MRTRNRLVLAAILGLSAAGCAVRIAPPRSAAGATDPRAAWARVLDRYVDDHGRIDFAGVARDPADLEAYVAWLATAAPASEPGAMPTAATRLAFDINAYNALALYDVIRSNMPADLNVVKVRFFYKNRFELGGRPTSLYAFENKVIRPIGDPRVHFALNCMARGCPRLPREPFDAERLDAQLEARAREFFDDPRHVVLDPSRRVARLSQILEFYTADFLAKSPSLIAYANRYRSEKIPEDWKVEFIPYDWALNSR